MSIVQPVSARALQIRSKVAALPRVSAAAEGFDAALNKASTRDRRPALTDADPAPNAQPRPNTPEDSAPPTSSECGPDLVGRDAPGCTRDDRPERSDADGPRSTRERDEQPPSAEADATSQPVADGAQTTAQEQRPTVGTAGQARAEPTDEPAVASEEPRGPIGQGAKDQQAAPGASATSPGTLPPGGSNPASNSPATSPAHPAQASPAKPATAATSTPPASDAQPAAMASEITAEESAKPQSADALAATVESDSGAIGDAEQATGVDEPLTIADRAGLTNAGAAAGRLAGRADLGLRQEVAERPITIHTLNAMLLRSPAVLGSTSIGALVPGGRNVVGGGEGESQAEPVETQAQSPSTIARVQSGVAFAEQSVVAAAEGLASGRSTDRGTLVASEARGDQAAAEGRAGETARQAVGVRGVEAAVAGGAIDPALARDARGLSPSLGQGGAERPTGSARGDGVLAGVGGGAGAGGAAGVGDGRGRLGRLAAGDPRLGPGMGEGPSAEIVQQRVMQAQVSRGLAAALRQSDGRVTINLHPESLGRLKVEVKRGAGGVSVRFEASTSEARDLLKTGSTDLERMLEARGFKLEQVQVHLRPDGTAERPGETRAEHPGQQGAWTPTQGDGSGGGDGWQQPGRSPGERGSTPERWAEAESLGEEPLGSVPVFGLDGARLDATA
jgi:flagellar hook-length control protein FliK